MHGRSGGSDTSPRVRTVLVVKVLGVTVLGVTVRVVKVLVVNVLVMTGRSPGEA